MIAAINNQGTVMLANQAIYKINYTFLRILVLAGLLLFSSAQASSKKYSTVEEFISDQTVIRVTTDQQPGFGNQAANANVMSRLRQMGFQGIFEFIYPDCVTDKIAMLFDLPVNVTGDYYDSKQKIRFIKMSEHLNHLRNKTVEHFPLGLTGAFRKGPYDPIGDCDIDTAGISKLELYNFSNFLNTTVSAIFDNYPRHSFNDGVLIDLFNEELSQSQPFGHQTFFTMPVASLDQASDYLQNNPKGIELTQKNPALPSFIDGLRANNFNIFSVYGFTLQENISVIGEQFPGNILQVIAGARYAQIHGSQDMHKPLIIPVFYDYRQEANKIMELIHSDNWGSYEQAGAAQARNIIKKLKLSDSHVFSVAAISDIETVKRIQSLQPGQILLLSMGPLPKIIFDGIYTYSGDNSWPQIREGASTFDSLVLTGKPHFRCRGEENPPWELGYDLIKDASLKSRFQHFYDTFCHNMDDWKNDTNIHQTLGELIIEAHDSKSALSSYFQDLKTTAEKPENDRIRIAIVEAMKRL